MVSSMFFPAKNLRDDLFGDPIGHPELKRQTFGLGDDGQEEVQGFRKAKAILSEDLIYQNLPEDILSRINKLIDWKPFEQILSSHQVQP